MTSDASFATIAELAPEIRSGALRSVDLTERLIERIGRLNGALHAIVGLTRERALAEAAAADAMIAAGDYLGPLHGIPYLAKDLFDVAGEVTAAGMSVPAGGVAAADGAVVRRLAAAGMILIGKTHTVQLAADILGINHALGTPHNPWHREAHIPGGSSSGSAVAVAAGLAPMALGTDTGGSVRAPAGLCGTVGLKTTVGRVSRAGVYPLSWTFDSVGPLTRSVEDAALVYQAMQGPDTDDDSTLRVSPDDVLGDLKKGVAGLDIAVGETAFFDGVDAEVDDAVRAAAEVCRSLGADVAGLEMPEVAEAQALSHEPAHYAVEGYAFNRAIVDGHDGPLDAALAWMADGRDIPAVEYFLARRRLADLRRRFAARLEGVDAFLVPTTALPARPVAEVDADRDSFFRYSGIYLRNTSLGNLLGLCAVSVPCGFSADGLPIGLMVYAKPFDEAMALRVAYAYQQATEWRTRRPDHSWAA